MTHDNRSRLTVNPDGNWRLYTPRALDNATALGTVTRGEADTGALFYLEQTGAYVQVNAGAVRTLDGRKVRAALGIAGRPAQMQGGKRINVYLDEASLAAAAALGQGNVSEGIRRALKPSVE